MVAACTASPNITQGVARPSWLRVIGTERLLCVEDTTLNSAPAKVGPTAIRVNPPDPAENVSKVLSIPAMPSIMSLAFEVDGIVTLIGTEQEQCGVVPLLVAGEEDNEGSKGFAVFAPLMPHTTNPVNFPDNVAVTVTVSPTRVVEAMAHHSPTK